MKKFEFFQNGVSARQRHQVNKNNRLKSSDRNRVEPIVLQVKDNLHFQHHVTFRLIFL